MKVIWKGLLGMVILSSFPLVTQAAVTCALSEEDAEYVCSTHLLRQNCSCIEIHSAAKQCFAYGKQAYQCSWN